MGHAAVVIGLFAGRPEQLWPGRAPSAIRKVPVCGPVHIGREGFAGDVQADKTVHGGKEKAIHQYSADHLESWQAELPDLADLMRPGCFGENISASGVTERDLCLGDVLSLGTARVQVCQGRQPCWKLNLHIGDDRMAARFQKSGRTGWYYRVLDDGVANVGDQMDLQQRPNPQWPLDVVIGARFNASLPTRTARDLSELTELSASWRASFGKKANPAYLEDTSRRLLGD